MDPGNGAYDPARQSSKVAEPAVLTIAPTEAATHAANDVLPNKGLNVPAGQSKHAEAPRTVE